MPIKTLLKQEVRRLRREERLSNKEIEERTGASRGSVSSWLKDDPLTAEERKEKFLSKRIKQAPPNPPRPRGNLSALWHVVSKENLTTSEKGKIAECAILLRLSLLRHSCYGSQFDGDRIDWVVETPEGKLLKMQVRCHARPSNPRFDLRKSSGRGKHKRFESLDFDVFVGYDLLTDTAYVFTQEETRHLKSEVTACDSAVEAWDKITRL